MKKLIAAISAFAVMGASQALAVKGPQDIKYTVHNLSTDVPGYVANWQYESSNEDEICIFCHTPHGGSLDGPLWNRGTTSTTYTHYSSATSSSYLQGLATNRAVSDESMLCLSCHDGSIAANTILNQSNRTGEQPKANFTGGPVYIETFGFPPAPLGAKIGASLNSDGSVNDVSTDLMDDHPISFLYDSVRSEKSAEFQIIGNAEIAGVRFFPPNGADNIKRVECSSCHDPHVNYYDTLNGGDADYTPFLITPNTGSALCLACHIK